MVIDNNYCGLSVALDRYELYSSLISDEDIEIKLDKPLTIYGSVQIEGSLFSSVTLAVYGTVVVKRTIAIEDCFSADSVFCTDLAVENTVDVKHSVEAKTIKTGGSIEAGYIQAREVNSAGSVISNDGMHIKGDIVAANKIKCGQGIYAFGKVHTASYIQADDTITANSIFAALGICAGGSIHAENEIHAGGLIFAGVNLKSVDKTKKKVSCKKLTHGQVVYGELVIKKGE